MAGNVRFNWLPDISCADVVLSGKATEIERRVSCGIAESFFSFDLTKTLVRGGNTV